MIRIVLGNLRSGTPADHARLACTALVAATGTVLLLCATAYATAGNALVGPVSAGALVLGVTAQLAAVTSRLTAPARIARTELLVGPGSLPEQVRELVAAEALVAGSLGTLAGLQAHLAARAVFDADAAGGAAIRDALAVHAEIPLLGLILVLGAVPAAVVAASVAGLPDPDAVAVSPRRLPGPVLLAAGLVVEALPNVLARPVRLPVGLGAVHPFALCGYTLAVAGTALTVPGVVRRGAGLFVRRARNPALLCAARRLQADAATLAVPLGLLGATTALLVTTRTLHAGPDDAAGDLPLLAVVGAAAVCGAAGLLAVLVEHIREHRDAARTLHAMGAAPRVERMVRVLAALLPVAAAWVCGTVAGTAAVYPLEVGGNRPRVPVSGQAVATGTVLAVALVGAAAVGVALATRRPAREGVTGWGRSTATGRPVG